MLRYLRRQPHRYPSRRTPSRPFSPKPQQEIRNLLSARFLQPWLKAQQSQRGRPLLGRLQPSIAGGRAPHEIPGHGHWSNHPLFAINGTHRRHGGDIFLNALTPQFTKNTLPQHDHLPPCCAFAFVSVFGRRRRRSRSNSPGRSKRMKSRSRDRRGRDVAPVREFERPPPETLDRRRVEKVGRAGRDEPRRVPRDRYEARTFCVSLRATVI